ncbi:hypothetical protein [Runella sp. SP2]|uniref:hypothetical protein n=1 Tax=Runella sp. SP2 TaxID=2268026 RepID=UPI000F086803|nr:hypothetical protein [Runella sp. SP2]AYQ31897.1 hypothetical protein DTQ70_06785 [Runella sp. SP2]
MRKILLIGLVALVGLRCKSSSEAMMMPSGCASEKPIVEGKWTMTEFRYFGGCCPVIADSTWKKAANNSYLLEFTNNGKLKVTDFGSAGLTTSNAAQLVTNYKIDGKEILLDEQIVGGVPWFKKILVTQLTTQEMIIEVVVGKEGEKNARKFVRMCE